MERQSIHAGDIYRHFRGNFYQIVTVGKHADSLEEYVVYQALYGNFEVYIRSIKDFFEILDNNKYPEAKQRFRFERVEKDELNLEKSTVHSNVTKEQVKVSTKEDEKNDEVERFIEESDNKEGMRQFMKFLDAETYKEKLEIFTKMQGKLDERILTNIAVSLDLVVDEKNMEESCQIIIKNLEQRSKFECFRLR